MMERWYVDISDWNPSPSEFSSALSYLPQHEQASITRYVKIEDRKRALVSRLLQYVLVNRVMGIPFDEILIKRTIEGKPYLVRKIDVVNAPCPNFNFNVSHHGDFVAIASEPLCIVGLDIVCSVMSANESVLEFIRHFSSYFSSLEWSNITNAGSLDDILVEFYRYWCLKEAFVKATGTGLAYQIDKVEFHHDGWMNIHVKIDGVHKNDWKFSVHDFGKGHWASVAKGHPGSASESFKQALKRVELGDEELSEAIQVPDVSFTKKTVEQLVEAWKPCKEADYI